MAHEVDADDGDRRELSLENGQPVTADEDDEDPEESECHA